MIKKEGNHDVQRDLAKMLRAMNQELERIGQLMVADVVKYLEREKIQMDGKLKASVNSRVVFSTGMFTLSIGAGAKYAYFVHEGRKPGGKFPPVRPIRQWVTKKLGIRDEKERKVITFLVRRKIAREGIKGKPFIGDVYKEWEARLQARIDNAIAGALSDV